MAVSVSSHCCAEASSDPCLPRDASLQILEKILFPCEKGLLISDEGVKLLDQGVLNMHL